MVELMGSINRRCRRRRGLRCCEPQHPTAFGRCWHAVLLPGLVGGYAPSIDSAQARSNLCACFLRVSVAMPVSVQTRIY